MPQDFVVRVADVLHSKKTRLSLRAAFTHLETAPATNYSPAGKMNLIATRSDQLKAIYADSNEQTSMRFFDQGGKMVNYLEMDSTESIDQIVFSPKDIRKVASVEIISAPFLYIRFPNVALNPK